MLTLPNSDRLRQHATDGAIRIDRRINDFVLGEIGTTTNQREAEKGETMTAARRHHRVDKDSGVFTAMAIDRKWWKAMVHESVVADP